MPPLSCLAVALICFSSPLATKPATSQTVEAAIKPTEIGPATLLAEEHRDLSKITFTDPVTNKPMLDATYTDGFLVLHHGRVISESYRNGMSANDPHMLMSVSKSIMGTLAGILAGSGQLDPNKLVTDYIPEMKTLSMRVRPSAICWI